MKLRFVVDQAAAFRRGEDCPKSIVTIEVDPADLDQEARDLIADRLRGIDVYRHPEYHSEVPQDRIVASTSTLDALLTAIRENLKGEE